MKGILLNTTSLGNKKYEYNDITEGIIPSPFPSDFYGGRITRFGKTKDGLLLCLEKNLETVIDIFVDFNTIVRIPAKVLHNIADVIKVKKLASRPSETVKALGSGMSREELEKFIQKNAIEIMSSWNHNGSFFITFLDLWYNEIVGGH